MCAFAYSGYNLSGRQQEPDPAYDAKGFQPGHDYFSPLPFEHIDTTSGNVYLRIPTLRLPGNAGHSLTFEWSYNSKDNSWSWGIAGIPMSVTPTVPKQRHLCGPVEPSDPIWYMPKFLGSDGAERITLWPTNGEGGDELLTARFWKYTPSTRRLHLGNGLTVEYDQLSEFGGCGMQSGSVTRVVDPHGNDLVVDYNEGLRMFQHLGNGQTRGINFFHNPDNTLESVAHDNRFWHFTYEDDPDNRRRLKTIVPPEGAGWVFDYTGYDLTKITTPNGGTVDYTFGIHTFWRDAVGFPRRLVPTKVLTRRTTAGRAIEPGAWDFDFDSDDDNKLTMTGPANRIEYHTAMTPAGLPVPALRTIFAGETMVQRESLTWGEAIVAQRLTPDADYHPPLLEFRAIQRFNGASSALFNTDYEYRGQPGVDYGRVDYGMPSRIIEQGERDRTTDIEYEHLQGPYVLRLLKKATVTVNGETFERANQYNAANGFREQAVIYGITTNFGNDGLGNVGTVHDTHDHPATTFNYSWGVLKDTATPEFTITRTVDERGTVRSETRNGHPTAMEYDALGRLRLVSPPRGYAIATNYAANGETVTENRAGRFTTSTLDGFGRVIATENSAGVRTLTAYDAVGRKTFESLPYTGSSGPGTSFQYDALDRLIRIDTATNFTTYSYSVDADVTIDEHNGGEVRHTVQQWSAYGDPDDSILTAVTDAKGNPWSYDYNAINRLRTVHQPGGSTRSWTYYPGTELVQQETHPEHNPTTFTYDRGRLDTKTDAHGQFIYRYDNNDRLTRIIAPDQTHNVEFAYDAADNRTRVENASVRSTFAFDEAERLMWRDDVIAGEPTRRFVYGYDNWDNVERIEYPSGTIIEYRYDGGNRVTDALRVIGGGQFASIAHVSDYHPSGAIKTLTLGNGIVETFDFDPGRYWLTRISGPNSPLDLEYGHDAVGNVTSVTDHKNSFFSQPSLEYDGLDRLTGFTGYTANAYSYDALGNRTVAAGGATGYEYNASSLRLDRVTSSLSPTPPEVGFYVYDPAGNLESVGPSPGIATYRYWHTPFNMIKRAEVGQSSPAVTTYEYDGDNTRKRRIGASGSDLFYHGSDGRLLEEYRHDNGVANARWVRSYVYLGGRLVSSITPLPPQSVTVQLTQGAASVSEGAGSLVATVTVSTGDGEPLRNTISVSYATVNGTALAGQDYTATSGVLTFPASTPSGSTLTITVPIIQDLGSDPSETFRVDLSGPVGAALGTIPTQTVTIVDDDSMVVIDQPQPGWAINGPFTISGWAVNPAAPSGTGVDRIDIHAYPNPGSGQPSIFLGTAIYGDSRPDVAAYLGASRFTNSGYHLNNVRLKPGSVYLIVVFARNTQTMLFDTSQTVTVSSVGLAVDTPAESQSVNWTFLVAGWAADCSAASGTGIAQVQVRAVRLDGTGTPVTIATTYGFERGDIAALCGEAFRTSGYAGWITLQPGQYRLEVSSYDSAGVFVETAIRHVTVLQSDIRMSIDWPTQSASVGQPFLVGGWAIDRNAPLGTGVDTVHVHAYPNPGSGQSAIFLGAATYGADRADVAAYFGNDQFRFSGYNLTVSGLPAGTYLIAVFPHSTVTGAFGLASSVTVTIQ